MRHFSIFALSAVLFTALPIIAAPVDPWQAEGASATASAVQTHGYEDGKGVNGGPMGVKAEVTEHPLPAKVKGPLLNPKHGKILQQVLDHSFRAAMFGANLVHKLVSMALIKASHLDTHPTHIATIHRRDESSAESGALSDVADNLSGNPSGYGPLELTTRSFGNDSLVDLD
ncbi:hypothetical protein BC835DRAFT_483239 [Cytidiella melzeri]|nr:hypothetical protein BC835DRAFT_483239 [Cytidiella melzeri]